MCQLKHPLNTHGLTTLTCVCNKCAQTLLQLRDRTCLKDIPTALCGRKLSSSLLRQKLRLEIPWSPSSQISSRVPTSQALLSAQRSASPESARLQLHMRNHGFKHLPGSLRASRSTPSCVVGTYRQKHMPIGRCPPSTRPVHGGSTQLAAAAPATQDMSLKTLSACV